jgi:tRNA modification GTPase
MSEATTRFAVLTPPGTAAVATIAVIGVRAWEIVRRLFQPAAGGDLPSAPEEGRFWYGRLGGPSCDAVVVAPVAAAEPRIELHCHGGVQAVRVVCATLADNGAEAEPLGAWPSRAAGTFAAMAKTELTRAPTLRTASIVLDQVHGAFERAVTVTVAALAAGEPPKARYLLGALAEYAPLGRHLVRPWRVVVAGAPNVGKSSLVNALAGYRRSVVTPVPGTTRDLLATPLAIDGWPVELIDTAGQHDPGEALEGQGIARARTAAATADLCLWIVDAAAAPVWPDPWPANALIVINKIELTPAWDSASVPEAIQVSAQTGSGLDQLIEHISHGLVPNPPLPGSAVPFTAELADTVTSAAEALAAGDVEAARSEMAALLNPA